MAEETDSLQLSSDLHMSVTVHANTHTPQNAEVLLHSGHFFFSPPQRKHYVDF